MVYKKNTLNCVLEKISKEYSQKKAIIFGDDFINYEQLAEYSKNLAINLRNLGIQKNDKVAVMLPNSFEYLYLYFACFTLGAWVVPLNTRWEREELKNVLLDSDAKVIIYKDRISLFEYDKIVYQMRKELPKCEHFVCLGKSAYSDVLSLTDLVYNKPDNNEEVIDNIEPNDAALLAYTSGTTGIPKGVIISHETLVLTSYYAQEIWKFEGTAFSVAPLYAAQGFLPILLYLVGGLTMKWNADFNPGNILSEIGKGNMDVFHTQPTMWNLLLSQPYFNFIDVKRLKYVIVSGSLCSYELAKKIEKEIGCILLNAYGLIEATGIVTLTHPDDSLDVRLKTVGSPIPGVECKIVDNERNELPKGSIGELAVRGYLMKGYYKKPEKTSEVIDSDGWLYTGDLAKYYEDGTNIQIVGRCKDMIIRGGFNVYPIDIEECILKCEKVNNVAVVGKPDDVLSELIVAFVIPKFGESITPGDVKRFCRGKIANYKVPDEVFLISQLPVILSGKVQKSVLQEWATKGIPSQNKILLDEKPIIEL